jgi:hypothetical protein
MARSVREEGGNGDSSSPPGGRAGFRWKRRPAVVHRGPNPRPHGYGSMTRGPRRCRVLGSNPLDPGASGSGRNPAAAMSVLGAAGAVGGGSGPATDGALALRTWRVADRRVAVRGRRACAADLLVDLAPLHGYRGTCLCTRSGMLSSDGSSLARCRWNSSQLDHFCPARKRKNSKGAAGLDR